jgi:hypothetical protein
MYTTIYVYDFPSRSSKLSSRSAGACIRFGRAGSGSDFDTDQSRSVYLVRLISIWYCNWFMLFMTLDMPDEGTR